MASTFRPGKGAAVALGKGTVAGDDALARHVASAQTAAGSISWVCGRSGIAASGLYMSVTDSKRPDSPGFALTSNADHGKIVAAAGKSITIEQDGGTEKDVWSGRAVAVRFRLPRNEKGAVELEFGASCALRPEVLQYALEGDRSAPVLS